LSVHVRDLFSKDLRKFTGYEDFRGGVFESISHFQSIAPKKKGDSFSTVLNQSGGILPFYVLLLSLVSFSIVGNLFQTQLHS